MTTKNHGMKMFASLGVVGLLAALFFGCSAAENAIDCNGICNRYKSCFDSSYDTDACESRCKSNANSTADYMAKTSDCSDCIDDKSCSGAVFNCSAQCAGIVP